MRLFDRFDKVYCINLDRRSDRIEHFDNIVNKFDLGNYTRFSAVDGSLIKDYNGNLKLGELGLVLSNLEIIKESIKNNFNTILILEDDCFFTDEIKNIDEYFKQLPDDWDMLYMGGNHNLHVGAKPPIEINSKVIKLHTTYSTHFVALKSTVFNHINVILEKRNVPLDVGYVQLQKVFNAYSFSPAIAKQIKDYSDIQNKITDYDWLIK